MIRSESVRWPVKSNVAARNVATSPAHLGVGIKNDRLASNVAAAFRSEVLPVFGKLAPTYELYGYTALMERLTLTAKVRGEDVNYVLAYIW